jgi:hypothetical protein
VKRAQLASVVAVVLVGAGCGGGDGGQSAAELVSDSVEATGAVESFHFTLDVQGVPKTAAGLQLTAAEGDVATPDRAEADVSGNFAGTPITTQMVAIGDDVWIKNPLSGAWEAIDVSTTPLALLDPVEGVLGAMEGIADPVDEGTEDVDGVELQKVSGTVPAADVAPLVAVSPSEGDVPVTLWIGVEDSLLRKIEVSGPVAAGEPDTALRVVEISRFDEPVTIEPPEGTG